MAIKDWAAGLRPREKLLEQGAGALEDAELLALFLRTGYSGKDAISLARDLLHQFQGLRGLLEAEAEQCLAVRGLGPAKYAQLQAILELARRYLRSALPERVCMTSASQVSDYLTANLRHRPYEVFGALFLDSQHRLIAFEELFRGSLAQAKVYPREIVRQCLRRNAGAIILVHNHPSGHPEPSQSDIDLTRELAQTLASIDVRVLDHFIVGDSSVVSLAERGLVC